MISANIEKRICITEQDLKCLVLLLDIHILKNTDQEEHIEKLIDNLDKADIIDEKFVPDELVIIDSRVSVTDLDSMKKLAFDLISTEIADLAYGKVSVLAPMGAAVLGCRTGDIVEWSILKRKKRFKIEGVTHKKHTPQSEIVMNINYRDSTHMHVNKNNLNNFLKETDDGSEF